MKLSKPAMLGKAIKGHNIRNGNGEVAEVTH